ncbi:MAG: LamG domain-containing protein, partial [Candidatus Micrarchaeota archaeon]
MQTRLTAVAIMLLICASVTFATPAITFVSPTPDNHTAITSTGIYVNTTTTNSSAAFIDWNRMLVGYWAFEESSTTSTVYDNSTWANDGKLIGATRISSGKFGKAVVLDGLAGYVDVPKSDSLNFNEATEFTAEMWVKVDTYNPLADSTLISKGKGDKPSFLRWSLGTSNGDYHIRLNGDGDWDSIVVTKKITVGTWHHCAIVFNGSEQKIYSYLDGVLIATNNSVNKKLKDATTNPDNIRFGTQSIGGDYLDGTIDEVR